MSDSSYFSITPSDSTAVISKPDASVSLKLIEFVEQAIDDGYDITVVNQARDRADRTIDTFEKFEELIDQLLHEELENNKRLEKRQERIKLSKQIKSDQLKSIGDIYSYLNDLIVKEYNTTAVTVTDLFEALCDIDESKLQLGSYEEPVYALAVQIQAKTPFVASGIDYVHDMWEQSQLIKDYIDPYLGNGRYTLQGLIDTLPDVVKNECSPDVYKAYRAVQLASNEKLAKFTHIVDNSYYHEEFKSLFSDNAKSKVPLQANIAITCKRMYVELDPKLRKQVQSKEVALLEIKHDKAIDYMQVLLNTFKEVDDIPVIDESDLEGIDFDGVLDDYNEQSFEEPATDDYNEQSFEEPVINQPARRQPEPMQINPEQVMRNRHLRQERTPVQISAINSNVKELFQINPEAKLNNKVVFTLFIAHIIVWLILSLFTSTFGMLVSGLGMALALFGIIQVMSKQTKSATLILVGYFVVFVSSYIK